MVRSRQYGLPVQMRPSEIGMEALRDRIKYTSPTIVRRERLNAIVAATTSGTPPPG
jgi:hypothetical protein